MIRSIFTPSSILKTGLCTLQDIIEDPVMGMRILLLTGLMGLSACSFLEEKIEGRRHREGEAQSQVPTSTSQDEEGRAALIRSYEKKLSSLREKEHYSKLLPWFRNDREKLAYLMLTSLEAKQQWALDNKIWSRAKSPSQDMRNLMQTGDIAIGMPMDYVLKSWGEPLQREVSGNPLFKNEKWRYSKSLSTSEGYKQERRTVYFEGGRVVGWETD
ncbi:MAG: hypothetical protein ACK5Y2_06415 [Bdellovibrionales bacterium]